MSAQVRWLETRRLEAAIAPPPTTIQVRLQVLFDGQTYELAGQLDRLWGAIYEFHRDALGGKQPGEAVTLVLVSEARKEVLS